MTDLTSNSQVFTASASEQHATFTDFFSEVIVTNGGSVPLWVNTDGSVATDAEAGSVEVPAGATKTFANEQVKSNWSGVVGPGGWPLNIGGTPQQNTPASGHGTVVSFISDASPGSGAIIVSAQ